MNTTSAHYDFPLVTIQSVPKLRVVLKVSKEKTEAAERTPRKKQGAGLETIEERDQALEKTMTPYVRRQVEQERQRAVKFFENNGQDPKPGKPLAQPNEKKRLIETLIKSGSPAAPKYSQKFDKINHEATSKYQSYITKQILQQHAPQDVLPVSSPSQVYCRELQSRQRIFKVVKDSAGFNTAVRCRSTTNAEKKDLGLFASVPTVNIKESPGFQKFFIKKIKKAERRLPEEVAKLRYGSKLTELLAVDADQGRKANCQKLEPARVLVKVPKKKIEISAGGSERKESHGTNQQGRIPSLGGLDAQRQLPGSQEVIVGSQRHEILSSHKQNLRKQETELTDEEQPRTSLRKLRVSNLESSLVPKKMEPQDTCKQKLDLTSAMRKAPDRSAFNSERKAAGVLLPGGLSTLALITQRRASLPQPPTPLGPVAPKLSHLQIPAAGLSRRKSVQFDDASPRTEAERNEKESRLLQPFAQSSRRSRISSRESLRSLQFDPVKQEQFKINSEIEKLKQKLDKHDIVLKDFVKVASQYTDLDLSQGLKMPGVDGRRANKCGDMRLYKRTSVSAKQEQRRKAKEAKRLEEEEYMKDHPGYKSRKVQVETTEEKKRAKLKKYAEFFNRYHASYGRAFRVLIDAQKEVMHRRKMEREKQLQQMTKEERTQLLIDKLNLQEQVLSVTNENVKDEVIGMMELQNGNQFFHEMPQTESEMELMLDPSNGLASNVVKMSTMTQMDGLLDPISQIFKEKTAASMNNILRNKILKIQDDFFQNLQYEQRSLNISDVDSFLLSCRSVELGLLHPGQSQTKDGQKLMTSKTLENKKILKYLSDQKEQFVNDMQLRLENMDLLLPEPELVRSPKLVGLEQAEQSQEDEAKRYVPTYKQYDISGFETLKYFMKYLKMRIADTEMNEELYKMQYYIKYTEYMIANRDKIERFAKREARKIKILMTEEKELQAKEDGNDKEAEEYQLRLLQLQAQQDDMLLFPQNLDGLKQGSYNADDLEIENLPLCHLFIFREEITKQEQIKIQLANQSQSFLLNSSAHEYKLQ